MLQATVDKFASAMQYNDGSFGAVKKYFTFLYLPNKLIRKANMKMLRVNFQVINPFMFGPGVVKWGLNPDDETNWSIASTNTNPLGGTNNNTILPQSFVFGIRVGFYKHLQRITIKINFMKKYEKIYSNRCLIILLITSFSSCKKFLEEKQVSNLTQDYYNNENGLEFT